MSLAKTQNGSDFTRRALFLAGGPAPDPSSLLPGEVLERAAGTTLTYGRRTSDIIALNLAGKGGLPHALGGAAPSAFKSFLGSVGKVLNLGLEPADRLAIDAALLNAEAVYCGLNH